MSVAYEIDEFTVYLQESEIHAVRNGTHIHTQTHGLGHAQRQTNRIQKYNRTLCEYECVRCEFFV